MILTWKYLACCTFAALLGSSSIYAQRAGTAVGGGARAGGGIAPGNIGGPVFGQPNFPPNSTIQPVIPNTPLPKPQVVEDEACLPWTLSAIRGATVSVLRLEVPDKARSEYNKACGDFRKKKFTDAEDHVRSAIDKYSDYVAAWVMLGQVLEEEQQAEKAYDACSHAEKTDPTYLPPYLCLAELDVKNGQWNEVLNISNLALGLNPVGDMYAYFYRAMAYFNLNRLGDAEKSALQAEGIDSEHRQASVHYLLAKIYEAKGDAAAAASEIKQFLKVNTDKDKDDEAKQYLAKLEGQDTAKQEARQ